MIKLDGVCVSYGEKKVLDGFSHTFQTGSFTCVMGASGCGKTTLLRVASGIQKPQSGSVFSDERKNSFVFQENRLVPWLTVSENLAFVGASRERSEELLRAVLLFDERDSLPQKLSGGMLRRVAVARCLALDASALFLDEPLRELDDETLDTVLQLIRRECVGKTVIMVTHSAAQAEALGGEILNID